MTFHLGQGGNYDRRSDIHNIIIGSLALALTALGMFLACLRWIQKIRGAQVDHERAGDGSRAVVIQLNPVGTSIPNTQLRHLSADLLMNC